MNILIFGATGRLGSELAARLGFGSDHVLAVNRNDADFTSPFNVARWIATQRPDVVINAAAFNGMEQCDRDPHFAHLVNAAAPAVLAKECAEAGALLIHFSTDYVFSGSSISMTLIEDDRPVPMGRYGWSKLAGEDAVRQCGQHYLILRVSSLCGRDFRGPFDVVRQALKGRGTIDNPVQVLHQYCAPSSTRMLADAVAHVVKSVPREDWPRVTGLYNLATSKGVWKIDYAAATLRAFLGDGPQDNRWCVIEGKLAVPRPVHTCLACDKFERTFSYKLPTWEEDLAETAKAFGKPSFS